MSKENTKTRETATLPDDVTRAQYEFGVFLTDAYTSAIDELSDHVDDQLRRAGSTDRRRANMRRDLPLKALDAWTRAVERASGGQS